MAQYVGRLLPDSEGAQNLIADVQQHLCDVLGPEVIEDDSLARYLVVLLCSGQEDEQLRAEAQTLLDEYGPQLVDW